MMEEVLTSLREIGYYNVAKVFNDDDCYMLRFIKDRNTVDIAISVSSMHGAFNREYVQYSEDKHLFYILLKEIPDRCRLELLNNICKEVGQYDVVLALNTYSKPVVLDYIKEIMTFMFVAGSRLSDYVDVYSTKTKPVNERNMLVALCKHLTHKIKQ